MKTGAPLDVRGVKSIAFARPAAIRHQGG